jgi:hypothetical protein
VVGDEGIPKFLAVYFLTKARTLGSCMRPDTQDLKEHINLLSNNPLLQSNRAQGASN